MTGEEDDWEEGSLARRGNEQHQATLPVALPGGGSCELVITVTDQAGNVSSVTALPIVIDNTPLATVVSNKPANPGDTAPLTITFNADIDMKAEDRYDVIELSFAGEPCWRSTITRIDARTYTLDGLLDEAWSSGEFQLTIRLDGLSEVLSGRPGAGTHSETWLYACDNLDYEWQTGWNALYLPFEAIHPYTIEMLSGMPCYRLADHSYVKAAGAFPQTALWVYCDDLPDPVIFGSYPASPGPALTDLPAGAWAFTGVGPIPDMSVPDNFTAWLWQDNRFILAETLTLGQAYWIYRHAAEPNP